MLPRKLYESYKKSVINLKIIAKTKEDVMTALTLAITGSILPHIALASITKIIACLLYTSPSPRDRTRSRMPSSA